MANNQIPEWQRHLAFQHGTPEQDTKYRSNQAKKRETNRLRAIEHMESGNMDCTSLPNGVRDWLLKLYPNMYYGDRRSIQRKEEPEVAGLSKSTAHRIY